RRAGPSADQPAEQIAEVADVEAGEVEVGVAATRARTAVQRTEAVVLLALVGVREHVVRGLHFLEALLRRRVAGVSVGVVLARELPVRLLDLVLRGALGDSQRVVEGLSHRTCVARRSRPARAARRGRRAGSPFARRRSRSPHPPPKAVRAAPRARAGRTSRPCRSSASPAARATWRAHGARAGRRPRAPPPRARRPRGAPARDRRGSAAAPSRAARSRA